MSRVYKCTTLDTNIYSGAMKAGPDGYYNNIILGALDVYNSAGEYYAMADEVAALFDSSTGFMSKIESGYLKSEMGHPKMMPGEKPQAFLARARRITEKNVCSFIKEIRLETTTLKVAGKDKPIILIRGDVKPAGPHAQLIKDVLEDEHANSAYSIRAFTSIETINGERVKVLSEVISFDWVTQPGIAMANKFASVKRMSTEDSEGFTTEDHSVAIDLTHGFSTGEGIMCLEDFATGNIEVTVKREIIDW